MTQVSVGRPLPPSQRSRAGDLASQWGPLLLTIATMALGAFKFNEDALRTVQRLETVTTEQRSELDRLRRITGELSDELDKFRTNESKWRTFADASFCALGARPPYGCPDVEYAPPPARGSSAPRIQPRVHAEPLDLDQ